MTWQWAILIAILTVGLRQALRINATVVLGWSLFIFGLLLDLLTVYLNAKRLRKGHGPSGLPIIPLIIYVFALNMTPGGSLFFSPGLDLVLVIVLHFTLQFVIPSCDRWFLGPLDSHEK